MGEIISVVLEHLSQPDGSLNLSPTGATVAFPPDFTGLVP